MGRKGVQGSGGWVRDCSAAQNIYNRNAASFENNVKYVALKEEADRRPRIDCLEEPEFCRKVVCALGIARTQIAADEMLTTT